MNTEIDLKDLKSLAKSMAEDRVKSSKFRYKGEVCVPAVVKSIAADLGHQEWANTQSHWLWTVVKFATLPGIAQARVERWIPQKVIHWLRRAVSGAESSTVTLDLTEELGTVECRLYGPVMGDPEMDEEEVIYMAAEGAEFSSRCIHVQRRQSSQVTAVLSKDGAEIVRIYGGPARPRQVQDPSLRGDDPSMTESREFWAEHAIAV